MVSLFLLLMFRLIILKGIFNNLACRDIAFEYLFGTENSFGDLDPLGFEPHLDNVLVVVFFVVSFFFCCYIDYFALR